MYKSVEKKFTDTDIKEIIEKEIKIDVLMQLPIEKRNKYIKDIYQHTAVSIRQLAKVLGTGKGIVEKAVRSS
ncbi:hypothetical protein [Alkaliphilus peptidifermentans]|uniref:Uncharacterized protein n=1 Tax=Alkaliphilus peptidifermentans DSM 18978 TaxID=1120976 RepID=A0A1G5LEF5_9FIRM|nr:hypothetical protein [Alkaliphilus peptidifermentans]SCZ11313.1 hypothetical protein SAMN03080606_04354 [Alkaliphilus peptidifermentans DSM 18978]